MRRLLGEQSVRLNGAEDECEADPRHNGFTRINSNTVTGALRVHFDTGSQQCPQRRFLQMAVLDGTAPW